MTNQTVHDPVCHMDILIAAAAGSSTHEGETYYFCSPGCKRSFDKEPQKYAGKSATSHSGGAHHG